MQDQDLPHLRRHRQPDRARPDAAPADHARADRRRLPGRRRGRRRRRAHPRARPGHAAGRRWTLELYRDVVDRIRARNRELIINLTTGPGGRFVPSEDDPRVAAPGSTLLPPLQRVEHIARAAARHLLARPEHDEFGRRRGDQHAAQRAHHGAGDARGRRAGPSSRSSTPATCTWRATSSTTARCTAPGCGPSSPGVKYGFSPARRRCSTPAACCRRAPSGRLSASAAASSRWWRRPGCWAAMCASGWRTTSTSTRGVLATGNAELVEQGAPHRRGPGRRAGGPAPGARDARPAPAG